MIGIIYKYTDPSGKVYIGQTVNEKNRRNCFLDITKRYAGGKIEKARKKYGPENFKYQVLFKKEYKSYRLAKKELNRLERKYIKKYDSFRHGLNGNHGGRNFSPDNIIISFKAMFKHIF